MICKLITLHVDTQNKFANKIPLIRQRFFIQFSKIELWPSEDILTHEQPEKKLGKITFIGSF